MSQRRDALVAEQAAELLADLDQRVEVFLEAAGERVLDHGIASARRVAA